MFTDNRLLLEFLLIICIVIFYYRIVCRYKKQIATLEKEIVQLKQNRQPIHKPPQHFNVPIQDDLDNELTNEFKELFAEEMTHKKVQFNLNKNEMIEPDSSKKVQEVPVQVQEVPVQVQEIPVQVQEIPVQVQDIPVQVQEVPVQVQEIPVQAVPIQIASTTPAPKIRPSNKIKLQLDKPILL